ncbi:nonselective cation channel [Gaeumannomyces tritici R3-111a-1]|uniref:Nonselective cation channel n=1 Tax=Gaeumannomyces tritici (strain R3-111a-1) TaxID=644352 RepID=J3P1J7_GAET3|nr:nonselective cation channel [Gaeumannomyces tritici R3-111a-1]EJT73539.1 nonselective cation channel [Gaeumannomyces tritici R3-111a-1]
MTLRRRRKHSWQDHSSSKHDRNCWRRMEGGSSSKDMEGAHAALRVSHDDDGDDTVRAEFGYAGSETEACLDRENIGRRRAMAKPTPSLPVYMTIHRVRRLVTAAVDDAYSLDQLKDPRLNKLVVRPLVDRLYDADDISIVYCILANRVQFLREQDNTVHQTVSIARATLCELLASQILRRLHEEHADDGDGLLLISHVLVEGFDPLQGAPDGIRQDEASRRRRQTLWQPRERRGHERKLTALELAIISESKALIASAACQRVVSAVSEGRVIYTPLTLMDILPDHYRHHPITLYDPRRAPILNHYRLIVPQWRNAIEFFQFLTLLVLYIVTMVYRNDEGNMIFELLFSTYTAGWVLSELAAVVEHGWEVHSQSLWSFLDLTFIFIYGAYVLARLFDIAWGNFPLGQGLHILCLAAPVLLTRLAFTLLLDNIVFILVHAVMRDFMSLVLLACWCFVGFLLALQWLMVSDDNSNTPALVPGWATIAKWMLWIWFGLDGTGMDEAAHFHLVFGPFLMVAFAFLGNTLFITIMVAMLTNTLSRVIADSASEVSFRRTVLTFEGVKSDAIFSYPPPANVLALVVLLPLKLVVSPAAFHSTNVALVRALNAPVLLLISLWERRRFAHGATGGAGKKNPFLNWRFTGFSPYDNVQAVFRTALPPEIGDEIEQLDPMAASEPERVQTAFVPTRGEP